MASEHVYGEVVEKPPERPLLSAQQQMAAVAEASGASLREASKAAGITIPALKKWHEISTYRDEVHRLIALNAAQLRIPVERMQTEIIEATSAAIKSLVGALDAEDHDGDPKWPIRIKAAEVLLTHGVDIGKLVMKGSDAPMPATAIQINLGSGGTPPDAVE